MRLSDDMGGTGANPACNVNKSKQNYLRAKKNKIRVAKLQYKKSGIRKLSHTNASTNPRGDQTALSRVNKKHVKKMARRTKLLDRALAEHLAQKGSIAASAIGVGDNLVTR